MKEREEEVGREGDGSKGRVWKEKGGRRKRKSRGGACINPRERIDWCNRIPGQARTSGTDILIRRTAGGEGV